MACVRVKIEEALGGRVDTDVLLEALSKAAVELSSGESEHTVASLEMLPKGQGNHVDVLGVQLDVEKRLRAEAGLSLVFVQEVDDTAVTVDVTYREGDRSDWEEWVRGFRAEVKVLYGTVDPS